MCKEVIAFVIVNSIFFCFWLHPVKAEQSNSKYKSFNEYDYKKEIFDVSKCTYSHGMVTIKIIQAKRLKSNEKSPHYCRAWIEIVKNEKVIRREYYDDISPVGSWYGLFVPEKQPSSRYFSILKHGDYDGRLMLVDMKGNFIDIPGGLFFITKDNKYLLSQYSSDLSGFTVFDLELGKEVFKAMDIPFIHQWYYKDGKYFFTESEWLKDNCGVPTEKPVVIYIYDFESKKILKGSQEVIKGAVKLKFNFEPSQFKDCHCD